MSSGNPERISCLIAVAAILLGAASCSAGGEGSGSTSHGGGMGGATGASVYAMTTNVWGPDGATGYLFTVSSLDEGEPDLETAIELPGGAWLTGVAGEPHVYVSSGEEGAKITRWTLTEEGVLDEGLTLSFEGLGVTSGIRFGTALALSPTKAYLLDATNGWVVSWNPRDMKLGKVIELDLEAQDGVPATLTAMAASDDRVFVTVAWESDWKWSGGARVITIDSATDEIVASEDEPRCEALNVTSRASDGSVYFAPQAFTASARAVLGDGFGTKSCALRVVPPEASLDQGWEVDLAALAGGRAAGAFALASNAVAFFRVFYQDEIAATAENFEDTLALPAYRWWRWEIGADEAEEIGGQDLSVEAAHYEVDGATYLGNPSEDWSSTTLVKLDPTGELRPGATVQGTPGGIARLR